MDYLRDGIGLRAMAQRDPLIEYQREGYDLFMAMMDGIREETVGFLFNVEVQTQAPATEEPPAPSAEEAVVALAAAAKEKAAATPAKAPVPLVAAKGLGPSRPQLLQYSAPTAEGGVAREALQADGEELVEVDPNASRAERRRAARANRKRK